MAKKNRGKGLWGMESRGRGTCPACGTARIKVLYDKVSDSGTIKVCKRCK